MPKANPDVVAVVTAGVCPNIELVANGFDPDPVWPPNIPNELLPDCGLTEADCGLEPKLNPLLASGVALTLLLNSGVF